MEKKLLLVILVMATALIEFCSVKKLVEAAYRIKNLDAVTTITMDTN